MSTIKVNINGVMTDIPILSGKSAYQSAIDGGFVGTESQFNNSLGQTTSHISNLSNPHATTAYQVGAYSSGQTDTLLSQRVSTGTTINGQSLNSNIVLSANNLGTYSSGQTDTLLSQRVSTGTTINGQSLNTNITLTASNVGAYSSGQTDTLLSQRVSTGITVNGHALSSNVIVTASDLGVYTSGQTDTLLSQRVSTGITVNGHALSSNIIITSTDLGVYTSGQTDTLLLGKVNTGITVNDQTLNSNVSITPLNLGVYTTGQTDTLLLGKVNTGITVNGQTLNGNVSITPSNLGVYTSGQTDSLLALRVSTGITVNGYTLNSNITITSTDLGVYTSGQTDNLLALRVSTGVTVNGQTLNGNVSITPSNLGVYTSGQTDTLLLGKSNTGHTHYQLYQPDGTNPFVYTDNSGTLHIDGNIVQSGTSYTTHANSIYTTGNTIILRDGAVNGLGVSEYVGFIAKLYDGVNDGQFVFDKDGYARVGDVGSLQKLATIEETPTNDYIFKWNSTSLRLESVNPTSLPISTLVQTELNGKVNTGTTINGYTLNTNINLTASNVGAYTSGQTDTLLLGKSDTGHTHSQYLNLSGGTMTGTLVTMASTLTQAALHISQGVKPTTTTDGDIWSESRGVFFQNNSTIHQLDADSNSLGSLSLATITDNGDDTINVASIDVFLYSQTGWTGDYSRYTIPTLTGLTLVDNSANYLNVSYNSGNPIFTITTNPADINGSNVLLVAKLWRSGTEIHYIQVDWGKATASRLVDRQINTLRYERSSGLMLSETSGNTISISSGVIWYGISAKSKIAVNSSGLQSYFYYKVGGVWTHSKVSTYNNTQYQNGNDLATLSTNNKHAVNWVYRIVDGDNLPGVAYVLGTGDYSQAQALSSTLPSDLPPFITGMAILVGKIIVQKSASSAYQITSAFTQTFAGSTVTNHESLDGLLGGTTLEHYHLTSTEYTYYSGITSNIQNQLNNKVNTGTTVNGYTLDTNITLIASNVGAYTSGQTDSLLSQKANLYSGNTFSGNQNINDLTAVTNNCFIGFNSTDYTMSSLYEKDEMINVTYKGTVTVNYTGSGTPLTGVLNYAKLFDGSQGSYFTITTPDSGDTMTILVDMGSLQSNYSDAQWQPYVHQRTPGSYAYFNTCTITFSDDNVTFYSPSTSGGYGGPWTSSSIGNGNSISGLKMFSNGGNNNLPSYQYRYVKYEFSNVVSGSTNTIYFQEIGFRHMGAPVLRQYVENSATETIYGFKTFSNQITSSVSTGTSPFSITSTTVNTNLNADLLDGLHSTAFVLTGTTINGQTLNGNVNITTTTLGVYTSGQTDSLLSSKANLYSGNTFTNKQIFQDVAADVFNVYRNVDLANNASAANITFSGDLTAKRDYASINSYRGSSTTGGALAFFTRTANNLSEKMRIKEDGKVGIATSAPSEILDVVGNIKLSGQLISTVTGSTAPLVVGNTTNVTNLNADLLDGFHSTDFVLTGTTINGQTLNTNVTITASGLGVYTSGETDSLLTGKTNAVMTTLGDIIIGGASGVATRLGVGSINTVLHGGSSPSYSAIVEADINLSNNTTNNVSTTKHGFAPILSNIPTQFLDGQGNWTTPTGIANSYLSQTFTSVTGVTITHNFGTYPLVQLLDSSGYEFIPLQVQHTTLNSFTVTFASSKSGTIISSVGSPQPQSLTIASGNYNILVTDRIIKCTGAGSTITLPTAVGNSGREFVIDNNSTSGINVNTTSSQTINGNPLQVLNTNNAMHVYSDGTNWRIY